MVILLFGVSNVGKTETGKLLAEKLGYKFKDLDDEVKRHYNTTLEDFVNSGTLEERDRKRGIVISRLLEEEYNQVIAISPISYFDNIAQYLLRDDVLAIELLDEAENIFDRLVFSDENDQIYKDDDYKNAHKDYYMSEIRADIQWYGSVYGKIRNKFYICNDEIETVVERIIMDYEL